MAEYRLADPKVGCHRTGFTKKCCTLVRNGVCKRWVLIEGRNPLPPGEEFSRWDCIDNHMLLMTAENTRAQHQTGKAIESFRNEMVVQNEKMLILQSEDLKRELVGRVAIGNGRDA